MVASTQWVTDKIHGRRQNPIESELTHLVTNTLTNHKGSLAVPGRGQRHRSHKICRIVIVMIPSAGGIHAQALLRVGTIGFGDTQTSHRECTTGCTRKFGLVVKMHAAPQYHVALFFEGHCLYNLINVFSL